MQNVTKCVLKINFGIIIWQHADVNLLHSIEPDCTLIFIYYSSIPVGRVNMCGSRVEDEQLGSHLSEVAVASKDRR